MKEVVRTEILYDLTKSIEILKNKDPSNITKLEDLSNHAIEDVAAHKDLDLVAITVLLYSLYKIAHKFTDKEHQLVLKSLENAKKFLQQFSFGRYNSAIKNIYKVIKGRNVKVKVHLQDVMQAAKVKKGAVLLGKGLSIGQAAGLMGLSNWDLQAYAGSTTLLSQEHEKIPVKKRVMIAFKIFGVRL